MINNTYSLLPISVYLQPFLALVALTPCSNCCAGKAVAREGHAESPSEEARALLTGIRGVDDLARLPIDEFRIVLAAGLREAMPPSRSALPLFELLDSIRMYSTVFVYQLSLRLKILNFFDRPIDYFPLELGDCNGPSKEMAAPLDDTNIDYFMVFLPPHLLSPVTVICRNHTLI